MTDLPIGTVEGDTILLSGTNAISVYNRGYYGVPGQEGVRLTGFEALHLAELERIEIHDNGIRLEQEQLTRLLGSVIDDFMGRYLVYKDLRNRGYIVNQGSGSSFFFRLYKRGDIPKKDSATFYVTPLREGSSINLTNLDDLVILAKDAKKTLVVGLVDASGDVSYLKINQLYPPDISSSHNFEAVSSWNWEYVREDYDEWER